MTGVMKTMTIFIGDFEHFWLISTEPLPCNQKQLIPAKPLLCLEYSFLEIRIGFVLKHITYHLFMQNFIALALAV